MPGASGAPAPASCDPLFRRTRHDPAPTGDHLVRAVTLPAQGGLAVLVLHGRDPSVQREPHPRPSPATIDGTARRALLVCCPDRQLPINTPQRPRDRQAKPRSPGTHRRSPGPGSSDPGLSRHAGDPGRTLYIAAGADRVSRSTSGLLDLRRESTDVVEGPRHPRLGVWGSVPPLSRLPTTGPADGVVRKYPGSG